MIKAQVKKYTPAMTKIRGDITSTTKDIEFNPTLSADDFNYAVPKVSAGSHAGCDDPDCRSPAATNQRLHQQPPPD